MIPVSSASFKNGGMIPSKYTCDGMDISPQLSWEKLPPGTKSVVITCTDPDAPGRAFIHWAAYNIPPHYSSVPEAVMGLTQAVNDFGFVPYGGPCPPSGIHRYYFTVYALNIDFFGRGMDARSLMNAMRSHVLDKGDIMGRYGRVARMRAKVRKQPVKQTMLDRAMRMVKG